MRTFVCINLLLVTGQNGMDIFRSGLIFISLSRTCILLAVQEPAIRVVISAYVDVIPSVLMRAVFAVFLHVISPLVLIAISTAKLLPKMVLYASCVAVTERSGRGAVLGLFFASLIASCTPLTFLIEIALPNSVKGQSIWKPLSG